MSLSPPGVAPAQLGNFLDQPLPEKAVEESDQLKQLASLMSQRSNTEHKGTKYLGFIYVIFFICISHSNIISQAMEFVILSSSLRQTFILR